MIWPTCNMSHKYGHLRKFQHVHKHACIWHKWVLEAVSMTNLSKNVFSSFMECIQWRSQKVMGQRSLKLILIFQPMFVCGVQMKSTLLQPTLGGEAGENYVHCITTKHSHGCNHCLTNTVMWQWIHWKQEIFQLIWVVGRSSVVKCPLTMQ